MKDRSAQPAAAQSWLRRADWRVLGPPSAAAAAAATAAAARGGSAHGGVEAEGREFGPSDASAAGLEGPVLASAFRLRALAKGEDGEAALDRTP